MFMKMLAAVAASFPSDLRTASPVSCVILSPVWVAFAVTIRVSPASTGLIYLTSRLTVGA